MTRFLAALAVAATLAAGAAHAEPGNALKEAAQMGNITPHGIFDAR